MVLRKLMPVLTVALLTTNAFGMEKAGMDSCTKSLVKLGSNDYAIMISKEKGSNLTNISSYNRGKSALLGKLNNAQLESIKPNLRFFASAGLVAGYVAVGAGAVTGGALIGVASFAASGVVAVPAIFTGGVVSAGAAGGAIGAVGAGGTIIYSQQAEALNPVAQFERANVEKCLKKSSNIKAGEYSVIKMSSRDDYSDTLRALNDLIHDLKH